MLTGRPLLALLIAVSCHPPSSFLHPEGRVVAEHAALAVGQIIDERRECRSAAGCMPEGPRSPRRLARLMRELSPSGVSRWPAALSMRARPGEGVQQIEAVAGAVLELGLQAVVAKEAVRECLFDGGEGLDRTACARVRQPGVDRRGLQVAVTGLAMDWLRSASTWILTPCSTDVGDLEGGRRAESDAER